MFAWSSQVTFITSRIRTSSIAMMTGDEVLWRTVYVSLSIKPICTLSLSVLFSWLNEPTPSPALGRLPSRQTYGSMLHDPIFERPLVPQLLIKAETKIWCGSTARYHHWTADSSFFSKIFSPPSAAALRVQPPATANSTPAGTAPCTRLLPPPQPLLPYPQPQVPNRNSHQYHRFVNPV